MHQHLLNALAIMGRVLLATLFVWSGFSKLIAPGETASFMTTGGLPAIEFLAVAVGLFELLAGLALGAGIQVRTAVIALAAFTLLASLMYYNFWSMPAEVQQVQQLMFAKNLARERLAA